MVEKEKEMKLINKMFNNETIRTIWNKLGEILGENYEEELLDELFSRFCVGK